VSVGFVKCVPEHGWFRPALRNLMEFGPPKSEAGRRTVALPAAALAAPRPHMLEFVAADQEALVFTGHLGGVLRTGNFRRSVNWAAAVKKGRRIGRLPLP
jgi:hypothetical protein